MWNEIMQDNDPKHTSKLAQKWMKEQNIKRWKTPAESPDLNPIDNLWHELRVHLLRNQAHDKERTGSGYCHVLEHC